MAKRKGVKVSAAVEDYMHFRRKVKRVAEATAKNEEYALIRMTTFLKDRLIANVVDEHMEAFFVEMNWAPSTHNQMVARIRQFWNWARERGYIDVNPMTMIVTVKVPPKRRKRPAVTLINEMIESAPDPRDRIFLVAAVETFLRAREITRWTVADVDFEESTIFVTISKTGQIDEMPMSAWLGRELRQWFITYSEMLGRPLRGDDVVFPSWANRFGPGGVVGVRVPKPHHPIQQPQAIIHRAMERVGIPREKGDGVHMLRRAMARHYFEMLRAQGEGDAVGEVGGMLHHARRGTTEGYIGTTDTIARRDDRIRDRELLQAMLPSRENVISLRQDA